MSDSTIDGFQQTYDAYRQRIDRYLEGKLAVEPTTDGKASLGQSMWHAVRGGKRIRPILLLASCAAVGGDPEDCVPAAGALELFHSYSLVHDDLPAMDDDPFRRGRPAVHLAFGEAQAILVGDALLTLGFEWLAREQAKSTAPETVLKVIRRVTGALGVSGMVGGQHLDIEGQFTDKAALREMQDLKTGALLSTAAWMGGVLGGGSSEAVADLSEFGLLLGRIYQLVDDLLDADQDVDQNVSMLDFASREEIRREADALNMRAYNHLEHLETGAEWLCSLANHLLIRNN